MIGATEMFIGGSILVVGITANIIRNRMERRARARIRLEEFAEKVEKYESRLALVDSIAYRYVASLGMEGATALISARRTLEAIEEQVDEADRLIQKKTCWALRAAEHAIACTGPRQDLHNWDERVENALQEIGSRIWQVAQGMNQIGLEGEYNDTVSVLQQAEISFPVGNAIGKVQLFHPQKISARNRQSPHLEERLAPFMAHDLSRFGEHREERCTMQVLRDSGLFGWRPRLG